MLIHTRAIVWTWDDSGPELAKRFGTVERSGPSDFAVRWHDTRELQRFTQGFAGVGVFEAEPKDWIPITPDVPRVGDIVEIRCSKRPGYGEHCMERTKDGWQGRTFGIMGSRRTQWDPDAEQPDQFRRLP